MNFFTKKIFTVIVCFILAMFSCAPDALTVLPNYLSENIPAGNTGTLYPEIQSVYPADSATGISPNNPGIVIVFTKLMENDIDAEITDDVGDEMYFAIQLLDSALNPLPYTLKPVTQSSYFFIVTPLIPLSENSDYTIRIYGSAYEDDRPGHTLIFDNLGTPGATYADFTFQTGQVTPADTTAPSISLTDPADLDTGVPVDLNPNGYVEIEFDEPVDPTTVNNISVTLYNLTDTLPVDGYVVLDTADTTFATYRFYPDDLFNYSTQYRLRVSDGDTITDFSGNAMAHADVTFTTASGTCNVDNYNISAVTSTSVTLSWSTSSSSIAHVELDSGAGYAVVLHDTTAADNFTETINGLTPNTLYSLRLSSAYNTSTPSTGPFDETQTVANAFRTLPDSVEGTTGNYKLAEANSAKSNINIIQIDNNTSFILWEDSVSYSRGQYLDTSTGSPETWDKWPNTTANTGEQIFNEAGDLKAVYNGNDGAIVMRVDATDSDIYAESVFDAGGALGRHWSGGLTGVKVYEGATTEASVAITYNGYVQQVASGIADTNFIYDSSVNFSTAGVVSGNHVVNEAVNNTHTTVSAGGVYGANLIVIGSDLITTNRNYRIGNHLVAETASATSAGAATATLYCNNGLLDLGDVVDVNNGGTHYWGYLTSASAWQNPDWSYTTNVPTTYAIGNMITTYDYITNGTAKVNVLYDIETNFGVASAPLPVVANDIVVNTVTGESDKVDSVYTSNNNLLVLNDISKFLFNNADNYIILRLSDNSNFITSGRANSTAGVNQINSTINFASQGVQTGDIIYRIYDENCAEIISLSGTTATLSSQIFDATSRAFIIIRFKAVTFAFIDSSDEVRSKIVDNSNGVLLFPSGLASSSFAVTTGSSCRNPHIENDLNGNSIIFYERYNGTDYDIMAKKVCGDANRDGNLTFAWAGAASTAGGIGLSVAANASRNDLIIKTVQDGAGGVWILYTSHDTVKRVGVAHITAGGTVTQQVSLLTNSDHPDMAKLSNMTMAIAYESDTVLGRSIYVQKYNNGPATVGVPVHVYSVQQSYTQINPYIIADTDAKGADLGSGCIVSWLETRYYPSIYYSIFAQHFDSTLGTRHYGDDKFVCISVLDAQTAANPYNIEHGIIRYNDTATPNAGIFIWQDERHVSNPKDLYFRPVGD